MCWNKVMSVQEDTKQVDLITRWNEYEVDLYPMVWKRNPSSFLHVAATFIVDKKHPHYAALKQMVCNWFLDVPMGSKALIDMTSKFSWDDDLVKKNWYVVDLRADPDTTWTNAVTLKNWSKLSIHAQNRLLFEMYEKVKGLVVIADKVDDVPETITTLSVTGLTTHKDEQLWTFIHRGMFETPRFTIPFNEDLHSTTMYGFHRFEDTPRYTYWPAW